MIVETSRNIIQDSNIEPWEGKASFSILVIPKNKTSTLFNVDPENMTKEEIQEELIGMMKLSEMLSAMITTTQGILKNEK